MKFTSAALVLLSLTRGAFGFSAVAPKQTSSATATNGGATSVDKTLKGIDADSTVFDPTSGENAALKRNNKDEVWVPQVCVMCYVGPSMIKL